jgi:hypothetical protein
MPAKFSSTISGIPADRKRWSRSPNSSKRRHCSAGPAPLGQKKHVFAYTGLIRCGTCAGGVTAEEKINLYGSRYVYYHCGHKKRAVVCREKSLEEHTLEEQIVAFLSIPEEHSSRSVRSRQTVPHNRRRAGQRAPGGRQRKASHRKSLGGLFPEFGCFDEDAIPGAH